MVAGLIVALGATVLWFLADLFLVLFVTYRGKEHFRWHWIPASVAGILALSAIWSPDPAAGLMAAVRIICLYSLLASAKFSWRPVMLVMAVHLGIVFWQIGFTGRPYGLTTNASQLGQISMVLIQSPAAPIAALTLGFSGARVAAAGLVLIALLDRSKHVWLYSLLAGAVFVVFALQTDPNRILPAGIQQSVEWRESLNEGQATPQDIADELRLACGEPRERAWSVLGYGYHGYCASTGLQRPHNLWVLSWYELGVLAVPLWALVFYGAWKIRSPQLLALLAIGMVTDESYARPEGFYTLALAIAVAKSPLKARKGWHRLGRRRQAEPAARQPRDGTPAL